MRRLSPRRRRRQRPGGHQFLAARIDREVQALEAARAEQQQIAFFGEHDLVDGEGFFHADDGKTHAKCP